MYPSRYIDNNDQLSLLLLLPRGEKQEALTVINTTVNWLPRGNGNKALGKESSILVPSEKI